MIDTTEDLLNAYPKVPVVDNLSDVDDDFSLDFNMRKHSPFKNGGGKFSDLTMHSDFIDFNVDSGVAEDTIDREIGRLINEKNTVDYKGIEEAGDTELLIRETHKFINKLPKGLVSSSQGENYQRLLTSSISKLVKQLEAERESKMKLAREMRKTEEEREKLLKQFSTLRSENSRLASQLKLKAEVERGQSEQRKSQELASVRERDLLREKLIKYKSLYEQERSKTQLMEKQQHIPSPPKSAPNLKFRSEPETAGTAPSLTKEEVKDMMLKILQERDSSSREKPETKTPNNNDAKKIKFKSNGGGGNDEVVNETVAGKISEACETIIQHASPEESPDNRDIVVRCFINYPPKDEALDSKNNPISQPEHTEHIKDTCKQCNSEVVLEKPGDTINLMGEYKWTI